MIFKYNLLYKTSFKLKQTFGNILKKHFKRMNNQSFYQIQDLNIQLPQPTTQLNKIFSQLKLCSKERLDGTQLNGQSIDPAEQIKGLKFISAKLAMLFHKNRKVPYNQISKILIDNFASHQNDQRNIKRRVYDAINVLVAAGVLIKKNNFVEMIKNKIKFRTEVDKKDKIYDQVRQKQESLQQKRDQYKRLIRKHKLIKKLFQRNMKNNQKQQKSSLKSSKTRKRNIQPGQNMSIAPYIIQKFSNVIYNPKIFIKIDQSITSMNLPFEKLIKQFKAQNRIQLYIPHKNMAIKENPQKFNQNQNSYMEEQSQQLKFENENGIQQEFRFIYEKDGVYTLIDLLELLSLDEGQLYQ